ncbi:MAG: UDP-N-acetylglucosamine 4,6-dehydratase (inverting) [Desulfovibrio sp.]|nr:UDP-N-acetylglucosamine 4,6-dehydratase (inverting) [Desulfovibrio sp.]MBI4959116.1 UDP-N-acetylglucosamine 4,6-dehydratase (inverting) [Desulfovibrio sp.]
MFDGKSILITGATGSFGQEAIKTILKRYEPKRLIIYSRDELKQWQMAQTLSIESHPCLRYFLGDVRDKERLHRALHKVNYIIHAAALKQVPAAEYNPMEAVKTNVLGAQNIIDCSIDQGVEKVLFLSTDKAVNPINLYGASKLCAEKMALAGSAYSGEGGTRFAVARYGNVFGSRGSVAPLFMAQRETGVLTLTDPRMTRFWITLEQAVDFVLNSIRIMTGGEIFVPKIPGLGLQELAQAICPNCEQRVVGIRPGEKLHETLVSREEAPHTTEFDNHYVVIASIRSREAYIAQNGGSPVPEDFEYNSGSGARPLTPEELSVMLGTLKS